MSATSSPPKPQSSPVRAGRSHGVKLIAILVLVVLMAIPIMFISFISFDRSSRADDVSREVGQTYGGPQSLLGPVLVIPFQETLVNGRVRVGDYVVSALSGDALFDNITIEEKRRSLYTVPVYSASGTLAAKFPSLRELQDQTNVSFDIEKAKIIVNLHDLTGLTSDVVLTVKGQSVLFEPYKSAASFKPSLLETEIKPVDEDAVVQPDKPYLTYDRLVSENLALLSAPVGNFLTKDRLEVQVNLSFTGANRLSVSPYAKSTTLTIGSDWPHPGFEGRFPPAERTITETGFEARWTVPFLRRGLPDQGRANEMSSLLMNNAPMSVNFVSPLNPYQTVNRALKYAVLFIGLVFLTYFLMETLLNVRVHPAQYLLIGIAQAVFYLLLLAFAEQIGFAVAFGVSAAATVSLTAGYAGAVFGRHVMGISAFVFGAVYGLLFILMRIQDFALMVGALISFIAIAATLYLTRNMDWYGDKMTEP